MRYSRLLLFPAQRARLNNVRPFVSPMEHCFITAGSCNYGEWLWKRRETSRRGICKTSPVNKPCTNCCLLESVSASQVPRVKLCPKGAIVSSWDHLRAALSPMLLPCDGTNDQIPSARFHARQSPLFHSCDTLMHESVDPAGEPRREILPVKVAFGQSWFRRNPRTDSNENWKAMRLQDI